MADVASVSVVDEHDDNDCGNLEPFFFDEAATQAAAAAKWRKWEDEEKAQEELLTRGREAHDAVIDWICEYDPKLGGFVYTRFYMGDFSTFDIDEECKLSLSLSPQSPSMAS